MELIVRRRPAAGSAAAQPVTETAAEPAGGAEHVAPATAAASAAAGESGHLRLKIEPAGDGYDVAVGERSYHVDTARLRPGLYSLRLDGAQHEVAVRRQADGSYLVSDPHGTAVVEVADPLTHLASKGGGAKGGRRRRRVNAYMPGRVISILVAEGEEVQAGQGVLVLEAMKMQNEILAEHDGTVTRLLVEAGQPVDGGDPLFDLE
jgi:biotin carboxyl carrier protein